MEREIRFRGLDKKGQWQYGDLICDDNGCRICYVVNIPPCMSEPTGDTRFIQDTVDFKTVGQFTGLSDKNGQQIFEGDIILAIGHTFKVGFENGSFSAEYSDSLDDHFYLGNGATSFFEVIGNIHQHPHLLTASSKEAAK